MPRIGASWVTLQEKEEVEFGTRRTRCMSRTDPRDGPRPPQPEAPHRRDHHTMAAAAAKASADHCEATALLRCAYRVLSCDEAVGCLAESFETDAFEECQRAREPLLLWLQQ